MTGYGQASAELDGARVGVELRSLNHRFADIRLRLPGELADAERAIRRKVQERFKRGRLELTVSVEPAQGGPSRPQLNRELLEEVLAARSVVRDEFEVQGSADLATVLSIPGMFRTASSDLTWTESEREALERSLDQALEALDQDRCREGRHLRGELQQRMSAMATLVKRIRKQAESLPPALKDRLVERLQALAGDVELDPVRIAQEAVVLADRADITEELVRLEAHLEYAAQLLDAPDGQPCGKRLDFLLQEINRETNTINSKSFDLEISHDALQMKTEIEKAREQIQNVE